MNGTTAERIIILGAGGHGRVVLDILLQNPHGQVVGFLDNNAAVRGRRIDGVPVYGPTSQATKWCAELEATGVIVAIGDNGVRRGLAREVQCQGLRLVNAVHPSASLAANVSLGRNVVIAAGVVVCAHSQIGDSVILNTGCIVDHQAMVGEGVHLCPGSRVAGRVKIESGAFVGIGATIVPRVTIGCEAIVGAGAVVTEDVPSLTTVVGVPARAIASAAAAEESPAMLLPARS